MTEEKTNDNVENKSNDNNHEDKDKLEHILNRKAKQADEYKTKYEEAMAKVKEYEAGKAKEEVKDYTSKEEFEHFKTEQRIDQFIAQNPKFADFSDTVKEFSKTPQGRNMQTKAMFYAVAQDKVLEMQEAKKEPIPVSNSAINVQEGVDFKTMDRDKFKELMNKARTQSY